MLGIITVLLAWILWIQTVPGVIRTSAPSGRPSSSAKGLPPRWGSRARSAAGGENRGGHGPPLEHGAPLLPKRFQRTVAAYWTGSSHAVVMRSAWR